MILSDGEIQEAIDTGELSITGVDELYIGASSVDLHLDGKVLMMKKMHPGMNAVIHADKKDSANDLFVPLKGHNDRIVIHPGEFHLWATKETLKFSSSIAGFVQGRSSIARLGLNIHNAGFADPGFEGTITLEVSNLTPFPIVVPIGTRICQMVFMRTGKPCLIPYAAKKDAKYQGQIGPTGTRAHIDYETSKH